jgi:FeS assembly protein IscX
MTRRGGNRRAGMSSSVDERSPSESLYWDASYAIARRLIETHPEARPSELTLQTLYAWTLALPDFVDDPALANDELLEAILIEWYEESAAHGQ